MIADGAGSAAPSGAGSAAPSGARSEAPDLALRLDAVRERIAAATARVGREPGSVRLVAVSKGVAVGHLLEAVSLGQTVLGENRVQEARAKAAAVPGAEWHMVGHLQTNKSAEAVRIFDCVHSLDSHRLAQALSDACVAQGRSRAVLVQVDLSGEASKHGVAPAHAEALVRDAAALPGLQVAGLMTIPPHGPDAESARPFFKELAALAATLRRHTNLPLGDLSMGMTDDFEVAIEEGATLVRVGRAVFGERSA